MVPDVKSFPPPESFRCLRLSLLVLVCYSCLIAELILENRRCDRRLAALDGSRLAALYERDGSRCAAEAGDARPAGDFCTGNQSEDFCCDECSSVGERAHDGQRV